MQELGSPTHLICDLIPLRPPPITYHLHRGIWRHIRGAAWITSYLALNARTAAIPSSVSDYQLPLDLLIPGEPRGNEIGDSYSRQKDP